MDLETRFEILIKMLHDTFDMMNREWLPRFDAMERRLAALEARRAEIPDFSGEN